MYSDLEFRGSSAFLGRLGELAARVWAEDAIRVCDDAEKWDWRAYVKARA